MVNIVNIFCHDLSLPGGVQRLSYLYAKALSSSGVNVNVFATQHNPDSFKNLKNVNCRKLSISFQNIKIIRSCAAEHHAINLVMPDSRARLLSLIILIGKRRLYLFDSIRFSISPELSLNKIATWLIENFLALLYPSLATYKLVQNKLNTRGNRCLGVIYNPIDFEQLIKRSSEQKRPLITYMGRLEYEKGCDRLHSIFLNLCLMNFGGAQGFDMNIWGEGSMANMLRTQFVDHIPKGMVHLKGLCTDPLQAISQSDVVILPSRTEGPSLTCAEAVCMGVPVVFFDVPGHGPEDISGRGGFKSIQNDCKDFSSKIIEAYNTSASERARIKDEARKRFSFEEFSTNFHNLISDER